MAQIPMHDHVRMEIPLAAMDLLVAGLEQALEAARASGGEGIDVRAVVESLPESVGARIIDYQIPAVEQEL